MAWTLERVPVAAGTLPEGPHWDAAAGGVYWVDISAGRVHFLDGSGEQRTWEAGQPVGAVAGRAGGGLVLAVRDGFAALDLATGQTSALAGVEPDRPDNRMNDGPATGPAGSSPGPRPKTTRREQARCTGWIPITSSP